MGKRSRHRKAPRTAKAAAQSPETERESHAGRNTAIALVLTVVLTAIAYGNATQGGFVYDDHRQIVDNPLIQQPQLLRPALTSDVWAFRGQEGQAASNYWRPMFTLWLAVEFALFGLHPFAWHLANIGLHLLATVLGFFVLRELHLGVWPSAAAMWIFATHPAHVESVTWISGSPDLLVTCFLFAAFLCYRRAARGAPVAWHALACVFFAGALMSKEIAVAFPLIVFVDAWMAGIAGIDQGDGTAATRRQRATAALFKSLPYLVCVALYLSARTWLMGLERVSAPGAPGLRDVLLTAPSLALFYLRHALFPGLLGPTYPPTPLTPASLTMTSFGLPLVVIVALLVAMGWLMRRGREYGWTLAWAILPLAPVFDIRSFVPDDLVHDRYLYLPLFGVVALVAAGVRDIQQRWMPGGGRRPIVAFGLSIALSIALLGAVGTRLYNPVWTDDIALWERGVETSPDRGFSHTQLAETYRAAGRVEEARAELTRALELNPGITAAHITLAGLDLQSGRLVEAQRRLEMVLAQYPNLSAAIEILGMVYQREGKSDAAIALYEHGRIALPYLRPLYTINLAVLHRLAGRSDKARQELESIEPDLAVSRDRKVLRGWYYLGELYREAGEPERAIAAYDRYLAATATLSDPQTSALRETVAAARMRVERATAVTRR